MGGEASPEQVKELQKARKVFEEVRPYGSHDAEAAYKKNPDLAREAAGGRSTAPSARSSSKPNCASIRAAAPTASWSDWQKLDQTSLRQYQAGDISGYRSTRSAMGDMARSLERDPQLESLLANRKRELGIAFEIRPPARPRTRLHPRHRPWQRPGHRNLTHPIYRRLFATVRRREKLSCAPATPVLSGLSSRQKQPAGGSAAMREPDRIVRLKTVLSRTGLSRSTIYRKIAEGTFPAQLKISTNGTGWHESDINRWIADPVAWRPKREFDEVRGVG